ncbi:MAG: hypothetical protein KC731_30960, partial [Myxococcales bacterium]|nr:hypothetical protein [Myxococcales bacterium]
MGIHTWGGGNCGCVDGAGVLALPSGGALAVEVNPALSGAVRLPNGTAIRMRNEANAADLDALEVDASNELHVGGPFVAANRVERTWLGADVEAAVVVDGTKRLSVRDLVELNASTLRFASSVSSPTVTQETDATASANGDALAIQAQTCTGASSVGGSVHVQPGQGTSQSGEVAVKDGGGTTRLNVTSAGDVVVSADSLVRLSTGGTVRAEVDSTALQLNSLPIGSETPAVTTRTLVWEMRPPTAGTTDHITRVYRYRYGLEVTVNARWTGTQW